MTRVTLIRLYRRLAALHPRSFRNTFSVEMQQVFAAQLDEVPPDQPLRVAALSIHEFGGLLSSIRREHWAALMHNQRRRYAIILSLTLYAMSLALLALNFHQASPGPDGQELHGLAIGQHNVSGGVVYLSGRHLACAPSARPEHGTRCTVTIAGAPLELLVRRNDPAAANQLGGTCRARYIGREWPCHIGLRHVHVGWFAFISKPLDLSPAELELLRRRHPLENLPERVVWSVLVLVPALTAAIVGGATRLWFRDRRRPLVTAASVVSGVGAWLMALTLAFHVTRGFWD